MKRHEWFEAKWQYLRRFGSFAIGGLVAAAIGLSTGLAWLAAIGFLLIVPWLFWIVLIPI